MEDEDSRLRAENAELLLRAEAAESTVAQVRQTLECDASEDVLSELGRVVGEWEHYGREITRCSGEIDRLTIRAEAAEAERDRLRDLAESMVHALHLGADGSLESSEKVERRYGNNLANLYLDICGVLGRGHRAVRR